MCDLGVSMVVSSRNTVVFIVCIMIRRAPRSTLDPWEDVLRCDIKTGLDAAGMSQADFEAALKEPAVQETDRKSTRLPVTQ